MNEDIQPLGEHPFGENISLYDGSLSFTQTDISLPGNGPTLQLTRHFAVFGRSPTSGVAEPVFADWELMVPHLETLTAGIPPSASNPNGAPMWNYNSVTGQVQKIYGWEIDNTTGLPGTDPYADINARCSSFTAPPQVIRHLGDPALTPWDPEEWWKGYHLIMPGQGGQDILANADSTTKGTYPAVTKGHWRFSCLSTTANGQPGDAFLGHAPDGTLYWFDYLTYRSAEGMSRQLYYSSTASLVRPPSPTEKLLNSSVEGLVSLLSGSSMAHAALMSDGISRSLGVLLVTKVQDRFGNTLNYAYDANGNLTGITASDGRALSVVYVSGTSRIQSVKLQPASGAPRTWVYTYSSDGLSLVDVALPDNTHWHYNIAAMQSDMFRGGTGTGSCANIQVPGNLGPITGTITHPSGLVGQFTLQGRKHGRSYVPEACEGMEYGSPDTGGSSAVIPKAWYSLTTTQVTFSGAGMPTRTWSYSYSPPNDSWSTCTGSCPTTVWTDVVAPGGSTTRSIFSNRYDFTESQLLRTELYAGAAGSSTLLRSEDDSYAPPTTSSLPAVAGNSFIGNINTAQITKYSPQNKTVINQDGDTYTWQAEGFNSYVQVTKTKRFNSISGQSPLEESLGYLNDTNLWVLGLPTTVTNVATGELESQNVYETTKDTLAERWRFGQKLMSYTFDSAGNLHTFTDGNTHTTTLSSYKRGIPQAIGYPDGTSESLVVDDFGQIRSLTDQAGKTTGYAYDGVGRLTQITYPTGDAVAWAPKVFSYDYVTGAERGIAANHWRRTISHGNARSVTYFDAELRPILSDSYDGSTYTSARTDYDWRGQKTFVSYPLAGQPALSGFSAGTTTTYDALGRAIQTQQTSELGPLTSTTAYLSGARMQVTDPKGKVTTTSYQVFDKPSYDAVTQVQAPAGINQTITRDIYGNPTSIRQYGTYNGLTSDLTKYLYYDSYHRLCRTAEPESGSTVMAYDGANNIAWTADGLSIAGTACNQAAVLAGAKTSRTYDAMNRVTSLAPPSGTQSTQYSYDARGNLATAVSGISTWSSHRNGLGLLTDETLQLIGQAAWTLGYSYDANGSLSAISYPNGSAVTYAPDALGRPTQAGSYASGVNYFPNGQVSSFSYGNGALYGAQQNARQLLSNFSYAQGSTLNVSEDYGYDGNANITTVTDLTTGTRNKAFTYDDLNRLSTAQANGLWGSESYTYDPLNNIRSRTGNGTTVTYTYNAANLLTGLNDGTTFAYDSRGNVINKSGQALDFDAKNQLMDLPGRVSYAYDAAGRRVSKTPSGGSPTYYFYSSAGQLMYQREPGSNKATNYIYLGKRMIARNEFDTRMLTSPEVNVKLTLVSGPTLSADAQTVSTTIDISNQGTATLTSSGPYPVHLGDHIVSATGTVLVNDLDRVNIPDIVPGQHAAVTITTAASSILGTGNRLQFIPVQEGVAWFTSFGTTPITVGPYVTPVVPATSTTGAYTITWAGVDGATSYTLQEQVNGGGWTTIQTSSAASTAISGKGNGTYGYHVQACNGGGCGPWSATASVSILLPPPAPGSIAVPGTSSGSIAVSWAASSTATSYTLQQRLGSGGWSTVYSGAATSNTRTVTATGSYTFQVQACNASGCGGWKGSAAVAVTIPPASAPSLSVPASNTTGSYTVSWTGVSGATSYTLQEQVNGGGWTTIQATSAISRAISGKGNGTYGYRVQACNVGGCGGWSTTKSLTVLFPPPVPGNIAVPGTSSGSIGVSWAASSTATSYTLQQRLGSGGWSTVYSGAATSSTRTVTATGSYTFQVQACNASGCSGWRGSSAVAVTIPPASAPSLSVPTSNTTGSYTVSWTGVGGATSYTLQGQVNGGGWTTVQSSSATSKAVSGKGSGTYGYRVQACNVGGCSGWSSSGSVKVLLPPSTPSGLAATLYVITDTSLRPPVRYLLAASWSAVSWASSYNLYYCQSSGACGTWTVTANSAPAANVGGAVVSAKVRACNTTGCSAWSATVVPTTVNE